MPIQSTDTTSQISFSADFVSWLITASAHVVTSGQGDAANSGVLMAHLQDNLTNLGAIVSVADAIEMDGSGGAYADQVTNGVGGYIFSSHSGIDCTQNEATVINNGIIDGYYGVSFEGSNEVLDNSGQIHANQSAVFSNGLSLNLNNSGEIHSGSYAIDLTGGPGGFDISNSGTIQGSSGAIDSYGGVTLHNTGSVLGDVYLLSSTGGSVITNRGLIDGAVLFGADGDLYDGRGGVVTGLITGGGGADTLIGGTGDDTLNGGAGTDRLDGGKGPDDDTFVFSAVADSAPTTHDTIAKHWGPTDVIDVSALDADRAAHGNQAFAFAGQINAGDPIAAHSIQYYQQGGDTVVVADVNGDGHADFEVVIHGTFTLTAGEFVL